MNVLQLLPNPKLNTGKSKNERQVTVKKQTMIERLREIRDKIRLETMDMSFEELQKYFAERSKIHDSSVWKKKYKHHSNITIAAEPKVKYGNK